MSGCGTVVSRTGLICPPIKQYSMTFQARVLAEKVSAEKVGASWVQMIDDYGALRAECRAVAGSP